MLKGTPFAPPIGPALPISWVSLSSFNAGVSAYAGGTEVKLDGTSVKAGMTPAAAYYTWADTTIRNTPEV